MKKFEVGKTYTDHTNVQMEVTSRTDKIVRFFCKKGNEHLETGKTYSKKIYRKEIRTDRDDDYESVYGVYWRILAISEI